MSNAEIISDLANARGAFLRESLGIMVRNHGPEDLFPALSNVLDAYAIVYAIVYARRTGDYSGANAYKLMAEYLDGYAKFVENYDPTVE
jgi:hypothetical protein